MITLGYYLRKQYLTQVISVYSEADLETLQQILFFKELGFPLKKIKEIINSPSFDHQEALLMHHNMLIKKRSQLDQLIATVDKTHNTQKEKFK